MAAFAALAQERIPIKVIPEPESKTYLEHRQLLTGPGVRPPKPYPGFAGFVGWSSVLRTRSGALLMMFTSGYWHASPPTPIQGIQESDIARWREMGMPTVDAPRGGRAEIMRSTDGGKTWSDPVPMIDTEKDDRAPAAVQLRDGTLVASFFTYPQAEVGIIRSFDDGKTWEQTPKLIRAPFHSLATDGPPLEMPDGSILLATYGQDKVDDKHEGIGIFSSKDRGETWRHLATIRAPHEMTEPGLARLKDGTLVVMARSEGTVCWSKDNGVTWTSPRNLPARIFDPWLLTLRDGTLLTLHGSYTKPQRGLRAMTSKDGGHTWNAAGSNYGFTVDPTAYGYSRGVELPDGSVYIVYQGTGGHKSGDAQAMSIYAMRIRVKKDGSIETLPATK
ncbi:MAG: sialidase family protein [Bryobacteraceae bacterium]